MLDTPPNILNVITVGDVSDEIDYFINNQLMHERGLGLTACQPSLVNLEGIGQAIRFKIDSTFVDSKTNNVMGYGQLNSESGFVGEIYITYSEENPEDIDIIYITPQDQINTVIQEIMENPKKYPPQNRPRGKY